MVLTVRGRRSDGRWSTWAPVGLAGGGSGAAQVTWCSRGPPGLRRTPGELDLPLCAKGPVPSAVSHAEGLPDIAARAPTGRSRGSLSGRPPSQAVGVNGRPEQSPSNVLLVCSNMHEIVPLQQNAKARPHVPGRLRDTPKLSGEAQGLRTAWPPSGPHRPVALLPAPWGLGAGGCPAPGGRLPGEPLALPAWARPRSSAPAAGAGPALSPPLRTCQKYFCNWNLIWKMFYK